MRKIAVDSRSMPVIVTINTNNVGNTNQNLNDHNIDQISMSHNQQQQIKILNNKPKNHKLTNNNDVVYNTNHNQINFNQQLANPIISPVKTANTSNTPVQFQNTSPLLKPQQPQQQQHTNKLPIYQSQTMASSSPAKIAPATMMRSNASDDHHNSVYMSSNSNNLNNNNKNVYLSTNLTTIPVIHQQQSLNNIKTIQYANNGSLMLDSSNSMSSGPNYNQIITINKPLAQNNYAYNNNTSGNNQCQTYHTQHNNSQQQQSLIIVNNPMESNSSQHVALNGHNILTVTHSNNTVNNPSAK